MTDRRAEALERLGQWEREAKAVLAWLRQNGREPDLTLRHYENFHPDVALRLIAGLRAALERSLRCTRMADPVSGALYQVAWELADAILGPGAEGTQEDDMREGE